MKLKHYNTKAGNAEIGVVMIGGLLIAHVALFIIFYAAGFGHRDRKGQTLPAANSVLPPATAPDEKRAVGDDEGQIRAAAAAAAPSPTPQLTLSLEPVPQSPGALSLHIPTSCQVDYSFDLTNWMFFGTYSSPDTVTVWTAESPTMFFRAHAVRP